MFFHFKLITIVALVTILHPLLAAEGNGKSDGDPTLALKAINTRRPLKDFGSYIQKLRLSTRRLYDYRAWRSSRRPSMQSVSPYGYKLRRNKNVPSRYRRLRSQDGYDVFRQPGNRAGNRYILQRGNDIYRVNGGWRMNDRVPPGIGQWAYDDEPAAQCDYDDPTVLDPDACAAALGELLDNFEYARQYRQRFIPQAYAYGCKVEFNCDTLRGSARNIDPNGWIEDAELLFDTCVSRGFSGWNYGDNVCGFRFQGARRGRVYQAY